MSALKRRSEERIRIAELVRLSLPTRLAGAVMGAELVDGRLVVAISGAAWASRVRYHVDALRKEVGAATGSSITGVRVKVVPTP